MIRSLEHQHVAARFPPSLHTPRQAREFVAAGVEAAGVDDPTVIDRLRLVTSELVTNAVVHADSDVEVSVVIGGQDIWLEVTDDAPLRPYRGPPATTDDTGGRGLVLVDALVDSWGVSALEGGPGKRVWVRIPL